MKVAASTISLHSQHEAKQRVEIEAQATRSFREVLREQAQQTGVGERERLNRMLQSLLEAILAAMEGRKCRQGSIDCRSSADQLPSQGQERTVEWRMDVSERRSESEQTTVKGGGSIQTADGRCIDFSVCLDMQRHYVQESKMVESGNYVLHDPLLLNFAGTAAELTAERIDFDLDADGCSESLPGLSAGCAYLVLDRNGNGRADNGSELFGTASGNGFADLARLDSDGNGWLDEADPEFAKLRLWPGAQSSDAVQSLAERGVGALWLGSVDSPFALKDSANRLLGEIRASGLWLGEDGRVGYLQQVDLALAPKDEGLRPT